MNWIAAMDSQFDEVRSIDPMRSLSLLDSFIDGSWYYDPFVVQAVLDTRRRRCYVLPGSIQVELGPNGKPIACRALTVPKRGTYADLFGEWTLISVPKLNSARIQ